MGIAALVTWLATAVIGFTMLGLWVARGGLRAVGEGGDAKPTSRFPRGLVFGHFLLAAAGLVVWIVYLAAGLGALAWLAFGLLLVVAILGDVLFVRWYKGRGLRTIESGLPKALVYAHGLLAVTTVILVLLTALGVAAR
ncbi:hypothetical protein GA0070624_5617 [Micromonospora rhizosphaerae]|uniref:DUF2269 family protein n=1 Tax=Micromonospora rhizosphaerae TaxID=568872 RepID=A0A1C6T526_9ACTN|nr:hypothetical protein [Micromonospora rhizosphaerae]SCL36672.1 hypothetical protein GA0070624_5617 [Micromonospora rhizosphaerae]